MPTLKTVVRRVLRITFWTVSCLLVVALILAGVAWRRSSTPLVALAPVSDPGVNLEVFRRGELQYPGATWMPVDPGRFGWDAAALDDAHAVARGLDTSSLMVLHRGVPIAQWGEVDRPENSQSIRKGLVSSLFGRLKDQGRLDLDSTLAELGIDDDPPLTTDERTATVRQLLLSTSGVYHSAVYEAGYWKRNKPPRFSVRPGEQWYYNNWGFNALSTVYESVTGETLAEAFAEQIAGPLGMEDFDADDVVYITRRHPTERMQGNQSDHPAYIFMISARDLARYGLLYLSGGRWLDDQVLPPGWVEASTVGAAVDTGWGDRRYGYLWWVRPPREALPHDSLEVTGGRGHKMTIVPALDLVVVHRIPTGGAGLLAQLFRRFVWHPAVDDRDYDAVLERLVAACPSPVTRPRGARPSPSEGAADTPPVLPRNVS